MTAKSDRFAKAFILRKYGKTEKGLLPPGGCAFFCTEPAVAAVSALRSFFVVASLNNK